MAKLPKLIIIALKTRDDGTGIVNRIPESLRHCDACEKEIQRKGECKTASRAASLKPKSHSNPDLSHRSDLSWCVGSCFFNRCRHDSLRWSGRAPRIQDARRMKSCACSRRKLEHITAHESCIATRKDWTTFSRCSSSPPGLWSSFSSCQSTGIPVIAVTVSRLNPSKSNEACRVF
jgi:hypothetical protein